MIKKWLALIGLLFILTSSLIGVAWVQFRREVAFNGEEVELWQFVQSVMGIMPDQVLTLSLLGLLLGVILTIPWWRERLRQEGMWWEKQDEPLDTPPRAGV